jgi:putative membrane protein insertion efficiency factor
MIIKKLFILPIKFYRYFISPLFPPSCRFNPTCSKYAIESIEEFGAFQGSILAIKRISKCHPWYKEG